MTDTAFETAKSTPIHRHPFSGVVVSFNESRRLAECLKSLAFCDQVILVDLGSADDCVAIGRQLGAEVVHHPWVPYGELARIAAASHCRHDWIVRLDPDEVLPPGAGEALTQCIADHPDAGLITACFQYMYCGRPLRGTVWSRSVIPLAYHRQRAIVNSNVHSGVTVRDGYSKVVLNEASCLGPVQHYWVDSFGQLVGKHRRYLRFEGKARFDRGERFSWVKASRDTMQMLKTNLIHCNGLEAGFTETWLSCFYAWYTWMGWMSLRRYEKEVSRTSGGLMTHEA